MRATMHEGWGRYGVRGEGGLGLRWERGGGTVECGGVKGVGWGIWGPCGPGSLMFVRTWVIVQYALEASDHNTRLLRYNCRTQGKYFEMKRKTELP